MTWLLSLVSPGINLVQSAADLINRSLRWKWPTNKTSNSFEKNRSLEPWVSAEHHPQCRVGTCTEVPAFPSETLPGLPCPRPHDTSSSRITLGPTLIKKEPLCSAFQTAETAPSPWAPGNLTSTFVFHFDGPVQTDICDLTQTKENKNLLLNHMSESISRTLSWMCGKYNCCISSPS